MIKSYRYKCRECGREVSILSKGLCPYCRSKELPKKERKPIRSRVKSKREDDNYSSFFAKHIEILSEKRMSMFSGKSIYMPSTCNICHILPKRRYKSVAKEDLNILYLTHDEHTRFDYLLDTLDFENLRKEFGDIYRLAVMRVEYMSLQGMIKEHGRLLDEFEKHFKKVENGNTEDKAADAP